MRSRPTSWGPGATLGVAAKGRSGAGVEGGVVAAAEGGERRWWREYVYLAAGGAFNRHAPPVEGEGQQPVVEHEAGLTIVIDDHAAHGKIADVRSPLSPVSSPVDPSAAMVPLGHQSTVELGGVQRTGRSDGGGHGVSVRPVGGAAAQPARSMTGGESHGVIEEEQRGPTVRSGEGVLPAPELGEADDP